MSDIGKRAVPLKELDHLDLPSPYDENRRDVVILFSVTDLLIQPGGPTLKPLLSQHHLQS
jgi:hypothetical protein